MNKKQPPIVGLQYCRFAAAKSRPRVICPNHVRVLSMEQSVSFEQECHELYLRTHLYTVVRYAYVHSCVIQV